VVDYPDGRLSIRYKGIDLAYRTVDKLRQIPQAAIVENERLGAALSFIRVGRANAQRFGARKRRAAEISATRACSRSAELTYEPSELMLAR